MPAEVVRFEPPLSPGLEAAIGEFDCVTRFLDEKPDAGELMVREYLRSGEFAEAAAASTSTTYLAGDEEQDARVVLGYVTLTLTQLRLTGSERRAGGFHDLAMSQFGAVRIAMIGVDRRYLGQGFGRLLLDAVIAYTASINEQVAARFVVADAVDTQLDWYRRQGFVENRSASEVERLDGVRERFAVSATSVRLDLGPDPRKILPGR